MIDLETVSAVVIGGQVLNVRPGTFHVETWPAFGSTEYGSKTWTSHGDLSRGLWYTFTLENDHNVELGQVSGPFAYIQAIHHKAVSREESKRG